MSKDEFVKPKKGRGSFCCCCVSTTICSLPFQVVAFYVLFVVCKTFVMNIATPSPEDFTLRDDVETAMADLIRPETWIGEKFEIWNQMRQALAQAQLHFEDTPLPPLFKLLPLVRAHLEYIEMHRKNSTLAWMGLQKRDCSNVPQKKLELLRYQSKFAALAYQTPNTIREGVSLEGYSLLQWEPQVGYTKPCYYVAMNAKKKTAVVAIRGTSSLNDVLTDVIHTPVSFLNGTFAHHGLLEAAKFVVNRTKPILLDLFEPLGYNVTFVGHSLAAGAATLATIIFEEEFGLNVRCFAFAPPPTLDDTSLLNTDRILAMVHNDDIIPRFNFGVLASTFSIFHSYLEKMDKENKTLEAFYKDQSFEDRMEIIGETIKQNSKSSKGRDMFIAGEVIYFIETNAGYIWQKVSNDFDSLRRFEFTRRQISDHAMDAHIAAIDSSLKSLDVKTTRKIKTNPFVHLGDSNDALCLSSGQALLARYFWDLVDDPAF